jgi:hypothetical protein
VACRVRRISPHRGSEGGRLGKQADQLEGLLRSPRACAGAIWNLLCDIDADKAHVRVLKDDPPWRVIATQLGGRAVVLKTHKLATLGSRIRAAFGISRLDRHIDGTNRLISAGIPVAPWLVLVQSPTHEILVMDQLAGITLLDFLAEKQNGDLSSGAGRFGPLRPRVRVEHEVARLVAGMLHQLLASGLINRDGKPSNLMLVGLETPIVSVHVLDPVGIGRAARSPAQDLPQSLVRMCASLIIEPIGCKVHVRKTLKARLICSMFEPSRLDQAQRKQLRRALWRMIDDAVRTHGDPTPRTSPIVEQPRS